MRKNTLLFTLIILSTLVGVAIGTNLVEKRLHTTGTVFMPTLGLEAYLDAECTVIVSVIEWGTLEPGQNKTSTIYMKNTGNKNLTLSMTTQNWIPTNATNYLNVTWTLENAAIAIGQVLQADLTLLVSNSVSGFTDYSFDIVIVGSD